MNKLTLSGFWKFSVNEVNLSKTLFTILITLILFTLTLSQTTTANQFLYGYNESCTNNDDSCWIPIQASSNGTLLTDVNDTVISTFLEAKHE